MGNFGSSAASKKLLKACAAQNYDEMVAALDAGAKIEARTKDGETPLWLAVTKCYKKEELALELLRRGANPKPKPPKRSGASTMLSYTMSKHTAKLAAALILAGAGADGETEPAGRWDAGGMVPVLCEMIACGFPDRARSLLRVSGVSINVWRTTDLKTPLMLAIEGRHRDFAIELCKLENAHGALCIDTSMENSSGSTALQMARAEGFDDVVAAIVSAKQFNSMQQAAMQQATEGAAAAADGASGRV